MCVWGGGGGGQPQPLPMRGGLNLHYATRPNPVIFHSRPGNNEIKRRLAVYDICEFHLASPQCFQELYRREQLSGHSDVLIKKTNVADVLSKKLMYSLLPIKTTLDVEMRDISKSTKVHMVNESQDHTFINDKTYEIISILCKSNGGSH